MQSPGVFDFDPDSPEFLKKLWWVQSAAVIDDRNPVTYEKVTAVNTNPTGVGPVWTLTYHFRRGNQVVECDGPTIRNNPDAAADAVSQAFGVPNAHGHETFEQHLRRSRDAKESPVGDPWAGKPGVHHFRPSVNLLEWPEGSTYTGDLDGRERTWRRTRVVIRPGEGPTGFGGIYEPAWILVG